VGWTSWFLAIAIIHRMGGQHRTDLSIYSILLKFSDGLVCTPRRSCHTSGILFGKRFGTVFTKLDLLAVAGNRLRPGATWTVNAVGLIHPVHGADRTGHPALLEATLK